MPSCIICSSISKFKELCDMSKRIPSWNEDELILALELYYRIDYGQMDGSSQDIQKLSNELRQMASNSDFPQTESFRSSKSVALKLNNFKNFDKNYSGTGMSRGSILDYEIWQKYNNYKGRLRQKATEIRQKHYGRNASSTGDINILFYKIHKEKELDFYLNMTAKHAIENNNELCCVACGISVSSIYGKLGRCCLSLHYDWDYKTQSPSTTPVWVCANCHRVLDDNYSEINVENLRKKLHRL